MRAVKAKDTAPEMAVRRMVHGMGYRYRLHRSGLPGKPDLVFGPRRKVIFVHGCFWHGHDCKRGDRIPKANRDYWMKKIAGNKERDQEHMAVLRAARWQALVVWECEVEQTVTEHRVRSFLDATADEHRGPTEGRAHGC